MVDRRRDLIFFGYSGSPRSTATVEQDWSTFLTAHTLRHHLLLRFPDDEVEVTCAWHKDVFVNALAADPSGARLKIRQIHYVGHGGRGVLSFGYQHPTAVADREALRATVTRPRSSWLMPAGARRRLALLWEASLVSGTFSDAISASKLAQIRSQLGPDALMHVWGCFAGAPTVRFDRNDTYWNLFNVPGGPSDGIARHIARTLGVTTTACWDRATKRGMNFCHRTLDGGVACPDERERLMPNWMWPASPRVRWVTYDATGAADETTINFLGQRIPVDRIPPGLPPRWFTDEIPATVTEARPPSFPACTAVRVGV